ncbi:MAG: hypothetical protein ACI8P3_000894 [Saprospiraceae bacterium]|jgi:hypothetical protein
MVPQGLFIFQYKFQITRLKYKNLVVPFTKLKT